MAKILVVDDEQVLVKGIKFNLEHEGYQVEVGCDGEQAVELAREGGFDLILLDLMMPKIDGLQACMRIREFSNVPIIMLTARGEDTDKIMGFECGADDYITKPFKNRELMARVKANIRRVGMTPAAPVPVPEPEAGASLGERVHVDEERATIFKDGVPLDLTQREYDLIRFLAARPGKIFSREALMEHVWNYEGYVGDVRAVDVAIRRLREKIEDDPASPVFIKTKRGMGYYFGE